MIIRDHVNAVLARLREDPALASIVFQGVVTDRPEHYVTLFADTGAWDVERFTGPQSEATFGFTIHSVSTEPDQAQWVAEHVFGQLLGYVPVVPDRQCRRLRHVSSQPMQLDRDVMPPLYYCVDVFDLTTSPA